MSANVIEIRDSLSARSYLLRSAMIARCAPLNEERLLRALHWGVALAEEGVPLPPLGFVADVGHVASGGLWRNEQLEERVASFFDPALVRRYEDYVVGRLFSDLAFERAADAVMRYEGQDQVRCLAFLINQVAARSGFGGVIVSPSVLKGIPKDLPAHSLHDVYAVEDEQESIPLVLSQLEELIQGIRNAGELVGVEDVFELETGSALSPLGQRMALRQVVQVADFLGARLPNQKPRGISRAYSVATKLEDEDQYPVGGFTSISNKGTVESLLRSELAYLDEDGDRPDLFDIKYVRDELLYYARDENQFLRRRLSFVFVLWPDLATARYKEQALTWQGIVLVLATIFLAIQQLTEWLSDDGLNFEVLIVEDLREQLQEERELLETVLEDQVQAELVSIHTMSEQAISDRVKSLTRTSLCHCVNISSEPRAHVYEEAIVSTLLATGACPQVQLGDETLEIDEDGDEAWRDAAERLLLFWV